ncbi:MAG TPA: hypothetical protein VFQ56_03275, partial [Flavobacterium sp.]|nr:hypothetical protein [Flavobacterium sp.]
MVKLLRTSKLQNFSKIVVLALSLSLFSCGQKDAKVEENGKFTFGVWTTADAKKSDADYSKEFKKYKDGGIDEVLINTQTDPKLLARLVPLATKEGLKVHAWIMA